MTRWAKILLLLAIFGSIAVVVFPSRKWEYRVEYVNAELPHGMIGETENHKSLSSSFITIDTGRFDALGKQGWELVSTSLEEETIHPNFGNVDYVTGLQPNIRPQRLICIFKRPYWF